MNIIRAMVDLKLSTEDIHYINELTARDTALAVKPDGDDERWCKCPLCDTLTQRSNSNFCKKCGQRLDTTNDMFL